MNRTFKALVAAGSLLTNSAMAATPPVCDGTPVLSGVLNIPLMPGLNMPVLFVERTFNKAAATFCDHFQTANGFKALVNTVNAAATTADPQICFNGVTGKPLDGAKSMTLRGPKGEEVFTKDVPEADRVKRVFASFLQTCAP